MVELSKHTDTYEPNQIPTKIRRKLYIYYGIGKWCFGELDICDFPRNKDADPDWVYILLCEQEVELDLPDCVVDVKQKTLEILEAEKSKILAENYKRLKNVQDKIDSLLALEGPSAKVEAPPGPHDDDIPF